MARRIRCAHCKGQHETVAQVKLCAKRAVDAQVSHDEAEAQAEAEMEMRVERFYEEGLHGAEDDPRERELLAQEDMVRAAIAMKHQLIHDQLERWREVNGDRKINSYGCVPLSVCNCPRSFLMCSAFAVLDANDDAYWDARIQERETAQDRAAAEAKMDRGFTLGGSRRRRPW